MSTQTRNSGGGRNQRNANSGGDTSGQSSSHKKTDVNRPEKDRRVYPKPTAEQLRIAQITTAGSTVEDPQMREKVATLIEMTQRSEEEVCCALNECDNNLERAVDFLLETLPVGAFETSSKKKKNKAANAVQDGGGDGDWNDSNANTDKREKSRNRANNRGGRGASDSRGWRGREARENERNLRESRGGGGGGGGGRDGDDRTNDNYRSGRIGGGGSGGAGGGGRPGGPGRGGYSGRGGRGGSRLGGRGAPGGRGDRRGDYASRQNANDDHQEVEVWDNTIAQNAEKQQQTQDDAWGDWDNEEYVGSLKDSKVFTTSNLPTQTVASVVSGGLAVGGPSEISAPPGLEHHQQQPSGLGDESAGSPATATPMMQYSAAVSSTPPVAGNAAAVVSSAAASSGGAQFASSSAVDTFSNAKAAAANLVQQAQAQQHQPAIKASATLSAEQSQYFNSLTSQNPPGGTVNVGQQTMGGSTYAQTAGGVQYPTTYANVFATGQTGGVPGSDQPSVASGAGGVQTQVRRTRAKLPPPSKIPATAVEMPGDAMNNIDYLDVQFGGLDFGPDDSFETLSEKFNAAAAMDGQQGQGQQQVVQDVGGDYQSKSGVQQSGLNASLQAAQIGDAISGGYVQRGAGQQQQVVSGSGAGSVGGGSNALDQLTKNDPYGQANASSASGYQSSYQSAAASAKTSNAYQQTGVAQGYNNSSYGQQQSVSNAYQPQSYGGYQQSSVNSYQQQATSGNAQNTGAQGVTVGGNSGQAANIPVGNTNNSASASSGYLSSGYQSQQNSYSTSQSVYGSGSLANASGYSGSTNSSSSQYSNFSTSAKLKDTTSAAAAAAAVTASNAHYDSVASNSTNNSSSVVNSSSNAVNASSAGGATNANNANVINNSSVAGGSGGGVVVAGSNVNSTSSTSSNSSGGGGVGVGGVSGGVAVASSSAAVAAAASSVVTGSGGGSVSAVSVTNKSGGGGVGVVSNTTAAVTASASGVTGAGGVGGSSGGGSGSGGSSASAGGMPNIQMVSQYIQAGVPYYQQPVYTYEDLQMMQQRVPHVQGYYDLNYTPTSLGTGRDNLGSVAYSTMTDARFARGDNNSSPVPNTMSQQTGSGGPMLNVPYAYFYGGMPGSFQYGTPAIYPQQIPAANTASGGQFPKPSYNTGYGSTSYDTLAQASQDYTKGAYQTGVNPASKSQNVTNQQQGASGSELSSSMYGKGHVALNKVNSYEKQNFHSGTPPPFNMQNTQTAAGTSAQPYGMYLPMPAGHHNMIHQPMHQDSNSTGQRQQSSGQSKSGNKQGYSPSYWTGQN